MRLTKNRRSNARDFPMPRDKNQPMTMPPKPCRVGPRRTQSRAAANDEEWLDEMVKKLFRELEKQLARVGKAGARENASGRAADARTLSSLERTLERLARLERERAAVRERKVVRHDEDTRTALERRMDKLLAAGGAAKIPAKPDEG
ncbi:MAG TPA: hypothetical protein VIJ72_04795 [Rhizomicrobium sp.]